MYTAKHLFASASTKPPISRPFALVAPLLGTALVAGAAGDFFFATVLTISLAFNVSLGLRWAVVAQAHGHLQLDGWAGLFVPSVALLFLPRLPGVLLAFPRVVPWILGLQVTGLVLRAISQRPLAAAGSGISRELLLRCG